MTMSENRFGWSEDRGFYGKSEVPIGFKTQPTDLELGIRKEVLDVLIELKKDSKYIFSPCQNEEAFEYMKKIDTIKDRLKLLWGNTNE